MSKIDLHIHSDFSDGRDTLKEIFEMAKENGLETVAIADHDMVSGVEEAIRIGKEKGIRVIPAVEISSNYRGQLIHTLGYNIDYKNNELNHFFDAINEQRKKHFSVQLRKINVSRKVMIDIEKFEKMPEKYFSLPGAAKFLAEEGIVESQEKGFDFMEGFVETFQINIDIKKAIEIIHRTGGKAVIAHPFAPKVSLKKISEDRNEIDEMIKELKNMGLDGMECYQTAHNEEETKFALELAKKYNLIVTGGSDWHGSIEKLGGKNIFKYVPFYQEKLGDLFVPEEIIKTFR